ncbi:protein of unknown function [Nitrospina watsonii]|uniref:Uncharacterized protein n=2 Tax=Nitrospina watsonii TaxID=1323948 RepID=A0ABN8VW89_9BACT|nr:protein of unknown function [Nitrospina watsonii]
MKMFLKSVANNLNQNPLKMKVIIILDFVGGWLDSPLWMIYFDFDFHYKLACHPFLSEKGSDTEVFSTRYFPGLFSWFPAMADWGVFSIWPHPLKNRWLSICTLPIITPYAGF